MIRTMTGKNIEVDNYLATLDADRLEAMTKLRDSTANNLPVGFEEQMTSMPSYVVPLDLYPLGYHTTKNTPLPFISLRHRKISSPSTTSACTWT